MGVVLRSGVAVVRRHDPGGELMKLKPTERKLRMKAILTVLILVLGGLIIAALEEPSDEGKVAAVPFYLTSERGGTYPNVLVSNMTSRPLEVYTSVRVLVDGEWRWEIQGCFISYHTIAPHSAITNRPMVFRGREKWKPVVSCRYPTPRWEKELTHLIGRLGVNIQRWAVKSTFGPADFKVEGPEIDGGPVLAHSGTDD